MVRVFRHPDGYIYPLESFKGDTFLVRVEIVDIAEYEAYLHGGPSFTDSLLLDEVAHINKVNGNDEEDHFHFHVSFPDDT